jgi:hypothetical protein
MSKARSNNRSPLGYSLNGPKNIGKFGEGVFIGLKTVDEYDNELYVIRA